MGVVFPDQNRTVMELRAERKTGARGAEIEHFNIEIIY